MFHEVFARHDPDNRLLAQSRAEVLENELDRARVREVLDAIRGRVSEKEYNAMSVKLELQADCFAGVWAKHSNDAKHWLEQGDIEEALTAATAIGDDTLQKQSRGYVVPDSFTHGSSAQRVAWFKRGWTSGQPNACNTFDAKSGV
mgnify:CR=1 FL=1